MIDLSRCTTVKSADLKSHKKHSFEISTPETTYLLYAGKEACNSEIISTPETTNLLANGGPLRNIANLGQTILFFVLFNMISGPNKFHITLFR